MPGLTSGPLRSIREPLSWPSSTQKASGFASHLVEAATESSYVNINKSSLTKENIDKYAEGTAEFISKSIAIFLLNVF